MDGFETEIGPDRIRADQGRPARNAPRPAEDTEGKHGPRQGHQGWNGGRDLPLGPRSAVRGPVAAGCD